MRAFLSNVAAQGFGLEVASLPELVLALRLLPGERVCFDSPAKTQDELLRALEAGVAINVDNFEELERIEQLVGAQNAAKSGAFFSSSTASHPHRAVIGIRINPQKESGSIAMVSTATRTSKFGIGLLDYRAQLLDAYSRLRFLNALHLHVGSQGCPIPLLVDNIVAAYEFLLEANERRKVRCLRVSTSLRFPSLSSRPPPSLRSPPSTLVAAIPSTTSPTLCLTLPPILLSCARGSLCSGNPTAVFGW